MNNREEATAWGIKFLNIWEANVVDKMSIDIHDIYKGVNFTGRVCGMKLLLDVYFSTEEIENKRNSYSAFASTDIKDIKGLNLSELSIARILSQYGAHKAIINHKPVEHLYCEGTISELRNMTYHLTVREDIP